MRVWPSESACGVSGFKPSTAALVTTAGLSHLRFEAVITAAWLPANSNDFVLVAMPGLLGLRSSKPAADIDGLGEEHGHRVLKVRGKGGKVAPVPLPTAVARAIDERDDDPLLRNARDVQIAAHHADARPRGHHCSGRAHA